VFQEIQPTEVNFYQIINEIFQNKNVFPQTYKLLQRRTGEEKT
jgi:hypothetical protein